MKRMRNTCRVAVSAGRVDRLGSDLVYAMRRLRSDLHLCERCPRYALEAGCPVRLAFSERVSTVIQEVLDEWAVV